MRLGEIEARLEEVLDKAGGSNPAREDVRLLVRAVRQLREVARYAEHTRVEDCASWEGGECDCGLRPALDALPDWILE